MLVPGMKVQRVTTYSSEWYIEINRLSCTCRHKLVTPMVAAVLRTARVTQYDSDFGGFDTHSSTFHVGGTQGARR